MGSYGKMAERSPGKDTTTGHWEIAGIELEAPFPTYPKGFPLEIILEFDTELLSPEPRHGIADLRFNVVPGLAQRAGGNIRFLQQDLVEDIGFVFGHPLRAVADILLGREGGFIPDLEMRQTGDK